MASRRAGVPALTGLGAAAVVAVGACAALALPATADETPSGSPSATTTPSPASYVLGVSVSPHEVEAGESATVTATVTRTGGDFKGIRVVLSTGSAHVDLGTTACSGRGVALDSSHGCDLNDVVRDYATVQQDVSLPPAYVKKKTAVTLSVSVMKGDTVLKPGQATVVFDPKPSPSPSSPKPTKPSPSDPGKLTEPPATPKPTTSSPSPNHSSTGGSGGGTGGNNSNSSGTGGNYTPPSTNGSFDNTKNPQVALPPITGNAPSPSVAAPDAPSASPQSTLRANKHPVAQEMTFQRVASTQIAWLAALLVACSLLLTQLRLGRRPTAPTGAAAAAKRPKGAHRRPRNGAHGK